VSTEDERAHGGDRFRAVHDIATSVLIQWKAPLTSGEQCTIPAGTVLVASHDQLPGRPGFGCDPENYEELLPLVVPEQDRSNPKFDGYYFVLLSEEIGRSLERLPRSS
jgi:hypothetical protein